MKLKNITSYSAYAHAHIQRPCAGAHPAPMCMHTSSAQAYAQILVGQEVLERFENSSDILNEYIVGVHNHCGCSQSLRSFF